MFSLSTKNKVVLGLLALASANGATFSLVNPSSLLSSLPSFGGGVNQQLSNLGNYSHEVDKLSLEGSEVSDIQLGNLDKGVSLSTKLDTSLNSGSVVLNLDSQNLGSSLNNTVSSIREEVVKETKVYEVDKKLNKTLEDELGKLTNQSSHFQSGYKKVEAYSSGSRVAPKVRRRRRDVNFQTATASSPLTREEKISLQKHLEVFSKLSKEKQDLFKKLEEAEKGASSSSSSISSVDFQKMLKALKDMEWNKDKLLLKKEIPALPSRRRTRSAPEKPNKDNLYGWKNWETSPWKPFFDRQEQWLELMDKLQSSEKVLRDYIARQGWCGAALIIFQASHVCVPRKSEYLKRIASDEEAISLHIAQKILTTISSSPAQLGE